MKKTLTKIICGILSVCVILSMTACGGANWKGTTMTDGGNVKSMSGFVAETDNYLYYINGVATNTENNEYGNPVKGAISAVKKSDLSTREVVVPKLFGATNRDQGLFIGSDNYVYYGSPNTEKNSSGGIASNELVFMKTSLDGKGTTEKFFTANSASVEYRIVEVDGVVYIIYYDTENTQLVSFNTKDKTSDVIAKTDAKAKKMSLKSYKFLKEKDTDKAVVIYTVTVYSEDYSEEKADKEGYTRPEEKYNQVYMYKAGDKKSENAEVVGTMLFDGNKNNELEDVVYDITLVSNGYVFFTEAINGKTKTYAIDLNNNNTKSAELKNTANIADTNLILSLDEVYILDTTAGVVYKSTLLQPENKVKKKVAVSNSISKMLFVKDGDLYYYTTDKEIAKINLLNIKGDDTDINLKDAKQVKISAGVVDIEWFAPVLVKVNDKEYLFYLDNSDFGKGYVKASDINAEPVVEKADKDAEEKDAKDKYYIAEKDMIDLSIMTKKDKAGYVTAKINFIDTKLKSGVLPLEKNEESGKLESAIYNEVKAIYDAVKDKEIKDLISKDAVAKLDKYAEAIRYSNLLVKLDGIQDCANKEDAKTKFESVYNEIKPEMDKLFASKDSQSILSLIENNYKAHYTKASDFFKPEK